ncbi:O-antigen ligase family protein [Micromonospora sp. NPDC007230]|uniref:O-antigen ligase family protein n=1 Tax=Micromonospora sp. NPDC007230 TaxID=3364237 RepID=UPI00368C7EA6
MTARPPSWSFNYAAILAVVAVALTVRLPRLHTADVLALLTGGWAYASLIWTDWADLTAPSAYRYASVCLLFVAARHVLRTRRDLLLVGWTFLAGCAVVAIEVITGARSQGPVDLFGQRYGIDGINLNFTAYTLTAGMVLALVVAAVTTGRLLLRLSPLAIAMFLGYAVLLTGCRGAAVGMVLGAAVLLMARLVPRLTVGTLVVVVIALVVLVPLELLPERQIMWLDNLYDRPTGDLSGRLAIWPYALKTWSEDLLTGSGAGVFIGTNPFEIGPHNLLLTVGNDLGLVGVLLYFGAIAAALLATARTGRVSLLLSGTFAAAMVPIWLSGQWETSLAFWLVLALISVLPQAGVPAGGWASNGRHHRSTRVIPQSLPRGTPAKISRPTTG